MFSKEFRNKLRLHVKDTTFTHPYEHLIRAIRFGRKAGALAGGPLTIVDVGAYDGKTAVFFHNNFPEATIHAFEPNPEAFSILSETVNGFPKIVPHKTALSDRNGTASLYVTHNKVSSSINPINEENAKNSGGLQSQLKVDQVVDIELMTLDSLQLTNIGLLKLDTQGNEVRVINGATETLKTTRIVISEMSVHKLYESGCSYFETDEALRKNGFLPVDFIVPARKNGVQMTEFDAIYVNTSLVSL